MLHPFWANMYKCNPYDNILLDVKVNFIKIFRYPIAIADVWVIRLIVIRPITRISDTGPITKIDTTYFVRSRRHQSQCSCIHKLVLHLWKCKFHHFDTDHDVDKHQLSKLEHPAKNLKCKYYSKVCK